MNQSDNNTVTEQETVQQTATPYVVAVAFSRWPLGQLKEFLETQLEMTSDQVGVMRIDRFKGAETNRTILLLSRSVYDTADRLGYTQQQKGLDFKLTEYQLRDHNLPKTGLTRNFFIPLPASLNADEAKDQLQNKLDVLCGFGMFLEEERPRLKIPIKSRETGEHRGQAYVTFSHQTPVDVIALARILLHDTRLYTKAGDEQFERMSCFWARDKTAEKESGKKLGRKKSGNRSTKGNRGPVQVSVTQVTEQVTEPLTGQVSEPENLVPEQVPETAPEEVTEQVAPLDLLPVLTPLTQ